jgi:predicted dehydrogenase
MMATGVALVGLGAIGTRAHLPALLRSPDVELLAIADADPVRLAATDAPHGVRRLAGLDDVLADDAIRGVVIATPPWVTPALAVRAARAGRAVLAEKPVAVDPEAARAYDVLDDAARARIQVGLTYRHDPAMVRLRELVAAGALGDPLLVRAHIYDETRTGDTAHAELIERTLAHGTPVIHEGAHVMDWLSFLLDGAPELVDAWSLRTRPSLADDNLVGARLRYGASTALVEFGWLTEGLPRAELVVTGDRGTAVLDGRTFSLTVTTAAGVETIAFEGDRMARCFDLQLARFAGLLRGGRAEPDLAAGVAALRQSAAIDRRAKEAQMTEEAP